MVSGPVLSFDLQGSFMERLGRVKISRRVAMIPRLLSVLTTSEPPGASFSRIARAFS